MFTSSSDRTLCTDTPFLGSRHLVLLESFFKSFLQFFFGRGKHCRVTIETQPREESRREGFTVGSTGVRLSRSECPVVESLGTIFLLGTKGC